MKAKTFNSKLVINKTTVANLDEETMATVNAGEHDPLTDSTVACGRTNTDYSECWTTPLWGC